MYLDNATIDRWGYNESLALCSEIRDNFDAITYPKGVELAGHPNGTLGDIDGDPKVTLLIIDDEVYEGGYYAYDDYSIATWNTHPNNREMIYIYTGENPDSICYSSILAHEFNHLIWENTDTNGDMTTIREGYADYAMYYSGYLSLENSWSSKNSLNRTRFTDNFSAHPEQSLLSFDYETDDISCANYGKAQMFIFYLSEKYGEELINDLIKIAIDGPVGIEIALANAGYDINFNNLYLDWITACTIDEEDIENGIYGFDNTDFTISKITTIDTLPFTEEDVKHLKYGFDVKKLINPPNEFTLEIANPYPLSIGISSAIYDDNGWSIAQTLNSEENGETIISHFTGENIEFAYIITSLMSPETPTTYASGYTEKSSSKQLSYSFMKGHKRASYNFLSFSILLIFLSTMIVIVRRRKRN
ncbi:MAG: hypothetical protein HGN29_09235 [Asgard group archaeon]|nr:hypothetical protein [Asgard group archaeon]